MRLLFCTLFMASSILLVYGQDTVVSEKDNVKRIIDQLFDGMRVGDSSMVLNVFASDATMASSFINKEGERILHKGSLANFAASVGTPHEEVWDERIWSYAIHIDGTLATAWTDYTFYLDDKLLHCGVNHFVLHQFEEGWKIISIIDTRRRKNCIEKGDDEKQAINSLLDDWHRAAATADEDTYFGSMSEDAIYIGTDATELWTKAAFMKWSMKYFERESAWDFTATERNIYFSQNGQMAWFDELLDTWMGPCRASGVLKREGTRGWKISHYQLSVTVPNEKIKNFIELLKE